jgi:uncharacterized Fe-S cluster protein YjdI
MKVYRTHNHKIIWKPELCVHCQLCVQGLPQVFKPDERPWVTTEAATEEEIIKQVEQCPSGALTHETA